MKTKTNFIMASDISEIYKKFKNNHNQTRSLEVFLTFYEVFSILVGSNLHYILQFLNMRNMQDGVNYYAEVHLSFWNSLIHTIFMSLTMLGMFLWIPAILQLNIRQSLELRKNVCLVYLFHYMKININIAFGIVLLYIPSYSYSIRLYHNWSQNKKNIFLRGILISTISLLIQESLGHYIGGDEPSRLEAIPNAIIYAPYYSLSHFF